MGAAARRLEPLTTSDHNGEVAAIAAAATANAAAAAASAAAAARAKMDVEGRTTSSSMLLFDGMTSGYVLR